MRLEKKLIVLGILVLGIATAIALSSKPRDHYPSTVEKAMPEDESKAKVEETESPALPALGNSGDVQAPVRHEEGLEMVEALKDFDASFKATVEDNRQDFATRLILRKLTQDSQRTEVYDWLTPYMNENAFLWQDPHLVHIYWSSCVSSRCNQTEFKSRLANNNPDFLANQADCMDSWADLMLLVEKVQTVTDIEVQRLKPKLKQCLARNGVADEIQTTQLQYFLGLVQMKFDRATAEAEYDALKDSFPSMPPFAELLPQ
jgi:hypothetical protein